ncbi:early nodulin-20 [Capsella rubella]|uniref:early nodulin-20 n=1 Tax=Capsella rubella TaxID=81985 RepID=UPI000CD4E6CB|nr:early nodulin-20 [Capsella rubella]
MATKKIFVFMTVIMFLLSCTSAKTYKVGGSNYGWTVKDDSWAEHKQFHVGDSLIFQYDKNVNDLAQVSNAKEYMACDVSSPKVVYNTGHDVTFLSSMTLHVLLLHHHLARTMNHHQGPSRQSPPPPSSKNHEPSRQSPPSPPPSKNQGPSRQTPPPPSPSENQGPSRDQTPPPPPTPSKRGRIYKVGDTKGWSVYNSYYYYRWSETKQFRVGDTLYFEYNKNLNDVREISDDFEFRSCEPTSTVAVYKTGHDLIKLTKPGVHYFVSLKTGLCQAGIKLRVNVLPSTEDDTNLPNVPKINRCNRWSWWLCLLRPNH